jgi:SAM-dependent methyltransferase
MASVVRTLIQIETGYMLEQRPMTQKEEPEASTFGEHMNNLASDWFRNQDLRAWVLRQTNAAMQDHDAARSAEALLKSLGLATHPDYPKNWDTFLAVYHAAMNAELLDPILDAGAERYSVFLPSLKQLGYKDLKGVNLTFGAPDENDGITFEYGDVTSTGLPDQSYVFVACLSVIEHGVDVPAFMSESARLLKSGGSLFLSFDHWADPVDTFGQVAYGAPIRIFTCRDLDGMLSEAKKCRLFLNGSSDFRCRERVVHWKRYGLRYTFANLLLRKG